jgi:hypothetical protein
MSACHVPVESSEVGMSKPWHVEELESACVLAVFVTEVCPARERTRVQVPVFSTAPIRTLICRVESFCFAVVKET